VSDVLSVTSQRAIRSTTTRAAQCSTSSGRPGGGRDLGWGSFARSVEVVRNKLGKRVDKSRPLGVHLPAELFAEPPPSVKVQSAAQWDALFGSGGARIFDGVEGMLSIEIPGCEIPESTR